ncbi:rhodanese-like domain-containing protein [Vibrio hannami]|uniref:rhodanese-like domain-containing protein n=1 Tax=Vibrio hannami TaxID=2717094 RepID=UPI003BB20246
MLRSLLLSLSLLAVSATTSASERADVAWQQVENGALLVDVRTPGEYNAKHLDNSINLPLNTIGSAFKDIDKNQNIVVYCRSGNRSGQAKAYLEKVGFTNVHNGGGLEEMIHAQHN